MYEQLRQAKKGVPGLGVRPNSCPFLIFFFSFLSLGSKKKKKKGSASS